MTRFLFLIIFMAFLFTQDISTLRILGKGELLKNEFVASKHRDANDLICAALIVESDLNGFSFDSNLGIVSVEQETGKSILYLSPGERVVEIKLNGYLPLQLILSEFGIRLKSKETWRIRVSGDKKAGRIPVNIIVKPGMDRLLINDKDRARAKTHLLPEGKHRLKIFKEGYRELETEIDVSARKNLFEFQLVEIDPVLFKIRSKPGGAIISINGVEEGRTPADLFKYPGVYQLELRLNGYDVIRKEIELKDGLGEFSYTLLKNTARLVIEKEPANTKIFINKRLYTNKVIELASGTYKIEADAEGYYPESRTVNLKKGEEKQERFILKAKTGKLQFTVQPLTAKAALKKNGLLVREWQGSHYIKDLAVGNYSLELRVEGFQRKEESLVIREGERTVLSIKLEKAESISDNFVFVRGGSFDMGFNDGPPDGKPVHTVHLSDFYIAKYEVTNGEYATFLNSYGNGIMTKAISAYPNKKMIDLLSSYESEKCRIKKIGNKYLVESGYRKYPVNSVSWYGANEYANWMGGRLPTEAEWEYSARGGQKSKSYNYAGSDNIDEIAWYDDNSGFETHIVGKKKANELGLYDMNGNVWEWCSDWYNDNYYSEANDIHDPKGSFVVDLRVMRGASCFSMAYRNRMGIRGSGSPSNMSISNGFRIVKD